MLILSYRNKTLPSGNVVASAMGVMPRTAVDGKGRASKESQQPLRKNILNTAAKFFCMTCRKAQPVADRERIVPARCKGCAQMVRRINKRNKN